MKFNKKQAKRSMRNHKSESGLTNRQINAIILIIFPHADDAVDDYFTKGFAYLNGGATQTRLHVDSAKFTTLKTLMGGVRDPAGTPPGTNSTEHTWNYVYPLEKDKNTFTHPLQLEKVSLEHRIKAAFLDIYTDTPDSAIIPSDTLTLGLTKKADRKKPTQEPELITETVEISLTPLGGGKVEVTARTKGDTGKPSKLNTNTDIEIAFSVIDHKDTPPATSVQCTDHRVITEADYVLELGELAIGMRLILFARWIYTKHPDKSGAFILSSPCTIA